MTDLPLLSVHRPHPGTAVLAVFGELDLDTAPAVQSAAADTVRLGNPRLVLDLDGVDFCDSAGLSAIIGAWHAARGAGGSLALACVPDRLMRMLTLTGVSVLLPVHGSVADALAGGPGAAAEAPSTGSA